MKNLLYKEFKLSIHPLAYVFLALMAITAIAPTYPGAAPAIVFGATYTFLFIGMNKTTTTNDLLYTCTLPIERRNVVKARIFSTTFLQLVYLVLIIPLLLLNHLIICPGILSQPEAKPQDAIGLMFINMHQGLILVSIFFICFAIFDLIYLPWFYKNGKSIIANMLVAILSVAVVSIGLSSINLIKGTESLIGMLTIGSPNANYFLQIGILVGSIALWVGSKFLVTKLATKNLLNLDF